jgi:predicted HD superfamily hydrolase involved in NAD metabolism
MEISNNDLLEFIKSRLSGKRLEHSENTAKEAVKLAFIYGADVENAYAAGILHDVAKGLPAETLKKIAYDNNIEIDEYEKRNTELLHGKIGALIIKKEFGIKDADILSAIEWHTTGHENMSLLEKIIYLADIIEPGRTFRDVDIIKELAYKDINTAMMLALKYVMDYVRSKGLTLHPNSLKAYDYLKKTEGNKV